MGQDSRQTAGRQAQGGNITPAGGRWQGSSSTQGQQSGPPKVPASSQQAPTLPPVPYPNPPVWPASSRLPQQRDELTVLFWVALGFQVFWIGTFIVLRLFGALH